MKPLASLQLRDVFVVVPTFNDNSVLRSTISGLLCQGYSAVVVDDGSRRRRTTA